MTICIAAACDEGKHIVVAADRMVTAGPPSNLEFEPPLSKIEVLGKGCVALASGSLPFADQFITEVRGHVGVDPPMPVAKVCERATESYAAFRNRIMDQQFVTATLGQDFSNLRGKATLPQYLQPQPQVYQQIFIQCQQFDLGLQVLIAGVDMTGANISVIVNPGFWQCLNKLGYAAVGTGAIHALSTLHLSGQSAHMSVPQTLVSAYSAKCAAEVAPGVGRETDMAVVSLGATWPCTESVIEKIREAHQQYAQRGKPNCDEVQQSYETEHKQPS